MQRLFYTHIIFDRFLKYMYIYIFKFPQIKKNGEGNGNPLQYSCVENPMDRGAWQATVHGLAKSQTQLRD